jgi:hypothetical protein
LENKIINIPFLQRLEKYYAIGQIPLVLADTTQVSGHLVSCAQAINYDFSSISYYETTFYRIILDKSQFAKIGLHIASISVLYLI